VIRSFGLLINLFPDGFALWAGRQLGRLAYFFDFEHRHVALKNLELAFGGEKKGNEIRGIALRNFENLGMNLIEFLRFPKVKHEKLMEKVEMEGRSHIEEALKRGKGIIFLLGHIGNWELLGCMSRVFAGNLMAIARPLKKNRWLDRFIGPGQYPAPHRDFGVHHQAPSRSVVLDPPEVGEKAKGSDSIQDAPVSQINTRIHGADTLEGR